MEHLIKNTYLHKFRALAPLMELARQENPADILAWFGAREMLRDIRDMLVRRYAWAVPSTQALAVAAAYGPIVEVGAGSGYWAYLLGLAGAEVAAFDIMAPLARGEYSGSEPWADVACGSAEDAVRAHPERTLFLCWPPADDPMAFRALSLTRAEHLIFVGWQDDDITGSREFHQLIRKSWRLVEAVEIPQWPEMRDRLFVYRRA